MSKSIILFDREMLIEKEYDVAVCVWETTASNTDTYDDALIELGQKIYNIKILNSGSIIFTLSPEDTVYLVTMFPQMFGFPSYDQLIEVKKLEALIKKSQNRINDIYTSIERAGYTEIP